jgi:hypothetical protein
LCFIYPVKITDFLAYSAIGCKTCVYEHVAPPNNGKIV